LGRRKVSEARVFAMDIVIGFDVVENFRSGVLFVDEAAVLKDFVF
jgi:hypothetical protein